MQFNIHKRDLGGKDITAGYNTAWSWTLDRADGTTVCRSADDFMTEKLARSNIAKAKTAMKGAQRCKVVTQETT